MIYDQDALRNRSAQEGGARPVSAEQACWEGRGLFLEDSANKACANYGCCAGLASTPKERCAETKRPVGLDREAKTLQTKNTVSIVP